MGKFADLAILSEDLLTVEEDNISAITSDITITGGRVVHQV